MLWLMIALAVVALVLFLWGYETARAENYDVANSAIIPFVLGAIALVSDVILVVGYVIFRALQ